MSHIMQRDPEEILRGNVVVIEELLHRYDYKPSGDSFDGAHRFLNQKLGTTAQYSMGEGFGPERIEVVANKGLDPKFVRAAENYGFTVFGLSEQNEEELANEELLEDFFD